MEFQVKGHTYRAGRLDAFKALHVTRRLAPLLATAGGSFAAFRADPLAALAPIAQGVASLSDADAEYIINTCLGVVQRSQGGTVWANVRGAGGLMFEDIGLAEMLQIVGRVLGENLGDFFAGLPDLFPADPAPASSP